MHVIKAHFSIFIVCTINCHLLSYMLALQWIKYDKPALYSIVYNAFIIMSKMIKQLRVRYKKKTRKFDPYDRAGTLSMLFHKTDLPLGPTILCNMQHQPLLIFIQQDIETVTIHHVNIELYMDFWVIRLMHYCARGSDC